MQVTLRNENRKFVIRKQTLPFLTSELVAASSLAARYDYAGRTRGARRLGS